MKNETITPLYEFHSYGKTPRWSRDIVITEKIDGTNAQISIVPVTEVGCVTEKEATACVAFAGIPYFLFAGSRTRWIQPVALSGVKNSDNYGFAQWVSGNAEELVKLGPGRHFGEWWGQGINRHYGLTGRKFSLFNVHKWGVLGEAPPACCGVVPVLYHGPLEEERILECCLVLGGEGSKAAPGFMEPEGIMIFHTAAGQLFKKTLKNDESPKTQQKPVCL